MDISHRARVAKFCSRECLRVQYGQRREAIPPPATCALDGCEVVFVPKNDRQLCCCERHGKTHYNRTSRADGRQAASAWTDARRASYHRRRALKKSSAVGPPVLLADIAARDRWKCHLCNRKVAAGAVWPHPLSASLDHVVPLTKGGEHSAANVRLAHLRCNTVKGNRGGGEQLLLIG